MTSWYLFSRPLPQHPPDHLPGRRHRHGIDEGDLARVFMRGEACAHEGADVGGERVGRRVLGLEHDEGLDDFRAHRIGLTDRRRERHGRMADQTILDLAGADAVAGKPVPGHEVAVIRPDGTPAAPGELGQIAVRRPDPVMFLEYWQRPDATRDKFVGDWMTTGDQGIVDEDGYFNFVGRDDDVITSAGYRIGP